MGGGKSSKKLKAEDQITIVTMPKSSSGGMSGFTGGGSDGTINPMRRSGQVEEGEYVFNAAATKAIDPQVLDRLQQLAMSGDPGLNQKLQSVLGIPQQKSYATGGIVDRSGPTPPADATPVPTNYQPFTSGVKSAGTVVTAPSAPTASTPAPAQTDFSGNTSSVAPISTPVSNQSTIAPVGGTSLNKATTLTTNGVSSPVGTTPNQASILSNSQPPAVSPPAVNPISNNAPNYNADQNAALKYNQDLMTGVNPYYNQLTDRTLANYDANAAANNSLTSMQNANNPYMSTGAKNAATAINNASTESGRTGLQSSLAQNAQAAEQTAAQNVISEASGIQANQTALANTVQTSLNTDIMGQVPLDQIQGDATLRNNVAQIYGIDPNNSTAITSKIADLYHSELATNMSAYSNQASTLMSTDIKNGASASSLEGDPTMKYWIAAGEGLDPNSKDPAVQAKIKASIDGMYQSANALINGNAASYTQFYNMDGTKVSADPSQTPDAEQPGSIANVPGNTKKYTNAQLESFWNSLPPTEQVSSLFWNPTGGANGKGAPNVSEIIAWLNEGLQPNGTGIPDMSNGTSSVQGWAKIDPASYNVVKSAAYAVQPLQVYPANFSNVSLRGKPMATVDPTTGAVTGQYMYYSSDGKPEYGNIGDSLWVSICAQLAKNDPQGVNDPQLAQYIQAQIGSDASTFTVSDNGQLSLNSNGMNGIQQLQLNAVNKISETLSDTSTFTTDKNGNTTIKTPIGIDSAESLSNNWNNASANLSSQSWYGGNILTGDQETSQGGVKNWVSENKGKIVRDPNTGRLYVVTGGMQHMSGSGALWQAELVDVATGKSYLHNAIDPNEGTAIPTDSYDSSTGAVNTTASGVATSA
jgi:hypothetical protein